MEKDVQKREKPPGRLRRSGEKKAPGNQDGFAPNAWDEVPIPPSTFRPHDHPAPEPQADGDPSTATSEPRNET